MNQEARTAQPRPMGPQQAGRESMAAAIRFALVLLLVAAGALAAWWARGILLLLFAGVLLGVLLDGASRRVTRWIHLPRWAALALILLLLAAAVAVLAWQAGPMLAQQFGELVRNLLESADTLMRQVTGSSGDEIARNLNWEDLGTLVPSPWGIASGATALVTGALGAILSVAIVLFFGIYFAAHPQTYVGLAMRLAPRERRGEVRDMLGEAGQVLRWWLKGQLLAMIVIGSATYAGLLLLEMPFALPLALFAGLTNFIPYIGPIISGAVILLVAAGEGTMMVLWALGLYLFIQSLESVLVIPLIQARAVWLAPVVVIANQLVFGALFGTLGLMLATPIAAVATVPLRRLFPADKTQA